MGGWLADRTGSRDQAIAGLVIVAVSLLLFGTINEESTTYFLGFLLAMLGAGVGLFAPSNTNANLASVPPKDRAMSNGILGMMRFTGQSLSLTIGTDPARALPLRRDLSRMAGHSRRPSTSSAIDLTFLVDAALAGIAIYFAFRGREPAKQKLEPALRPPLRRRYIVSITTTTPSAMIIGSSRARSKDRSSGTRAARRLAAAARRQHPGGSP